jgi:hypothetical protein
MLAITCEKCRRRFTPTLEALQGYLAANQGKKYALILCPHCGKGNKIALQRLQKAVRPAIAAGGPEAAPAPAAGPEAAPAPAIGPETASPAAASEAVASVADVESP